MYLIIPGCNGIGVNLRFESLSGVSAADPGEEESQQMGKSVVCQRVCIIGLILQKVFKFLEKGQEQQLPEMPLWVHIGSHHNV